MIGIRFNIRDFNRMMGSIRMIYTRVMRMKDDIPRKGAIEFRNLLALNITTQKHMGGYARYNERYAEWKLRNYGNRGFWRLGGHLLKSLTFIQVRTSKRVSEYFSGVPSYATDLGGKSWISEGGETYGKPKNISWYGRIMEEGGVFGNQTHPARPLFEPTTDEYAEDGWPKLGDEALKTIRDSWRT